MSKRPEMSLMNLGKKSHPVWRSAVRCAREEAGDILESRQGKPCGVSLENWTFLRATGSPRLKDSSRESVFQEDPYTVRCQTREAWPRPGGRKASG